MNLSSLMWLPFSLALLVSAAVTSLTIIIYRGLGLVDKSTKKEHKKNIHTEPVPRGGGIPIFAAMMFVILTLLKLDPQITTIAVGGLVLTILGVLDDVFDLSPYVRLLFSVLIAFGVVKAGIQLSIVSNPLGGVVELSNWPWISELVTVIWLVWTINFVNMGAKGLDGQLPGVVIIAGIVMGLLSFRFANDVTTWPSSYLAFALSGAYAGFLIFNMYPQKIMPGWGGGTLAGYFLGVLSILSGAKVATAVIVLSIPLMDVVYAIIRRIRAGKSPVWGDDMHLHHLLLKLGWSKRKVAATYWVVTGILGYFALQLNSQLKVYTIILTAVAVGGVLLWINLFLSPSQQE